MKITTNFTRFAMILGVATFINIAAANAGNIGVLDVDDIIKNSKVMQDIQSKVSKRQAEYQKEIDKKQSGLEAENKKIQSKKGVLSEEAFAKEQEKFEKKLDELREFVEKKQNSLRKASLDSMSKVNEEMKVIISEISKEKDLDLVVPASQTLFYKDGMDISKEVLEKLNKNVTKLNVKFE